MKPLMRWTLGDSVSQEGIDCLQQSISSIKKLYNDKFDFVICHSGDNVNDLQLGNVSFFDQRKATNSLTIKPFKTSWKLYPPRLRINSHEIFIDNDVVLYERHPIIDNFLSNDFIFCTEAAYRRYGIYDSLVKSNDNLNTGFFGLPPHFDFAAKLNKRIIGNWQTWFDEQGLVSSIFVESEEFHLVSLSDVWVCADYFRWGKYGIHFVGLNGGKTEYWKNYNDSKIKLI